jgi:hypothetical protein
MSVLFLFGAGASYGSVDCVPEPPPLGKDLFLKLVKAGGIARTVKSPMRELFIKDFEKGMAAFFDERNVDVNPFLRDMALYFLPFAPGPRNTYVKLFSAIAKGAHTVVVATTNYEMLIEQAIQVCGLIWRVDEPAEPGLVQVLKIHGSIHFLPRLGGGKFSGITFANNTVNLDGPISAAASTAEIEDFFRENDWAAPAIALYAPGKRIMNCPTPIKQLQETFRAAAASANLIIVVGLRVLPEDDHIWGTLWHGVSKVSLRRWRGRRV